MPPSITGPVSPNPVPTTAGIVIISGQNFGLGYGRDVYLDSPYYGLVQVDTFNEGERQWESVLAANASESTASSPPIPSTELNSHTSLRAYLPKGGVGSARILVTVGEQANRPDMEEYASIQFAPPVVDSCTPEIGTEGGMIEIVGSGFGSIELANSVPTAIDAIRPQVYLGSTPCEVANDGWTDRHIFCMAPPGEGSGHLVSVRVADQWALGPNGALAPLAKLAYKAP